MEPVGLFRLNASKKEMSKLAIHMAKGDYGYITEVKDPHVVSGYMKWILREMKDPLVPFRMYDEFGKRSELDDQGRIVRIKGRGG